MSYNYQTYLKETVVFQSAGTSTVDERGLYNSDWVDDITTKCRIDPRTSDEDSGTRDTEVSEIDIHIPANVNVKTSHRAVLNSKYYDVLGIEEKKNRYSNPVIKTVTMRRSG
jgi:hypothetical protein